MARAQSSSTPSIQLGMLITRSAVMGWSKLFILDSSLGGRRTEAEGSIAPGEQDGGGMTWGWGGALERMA